VAFVQYSGLCLSYGDRDLIRDATINLASGTRAALAGANGSGKSTLMKIIAGIVKPDSGQRAVQRGTRAAYLPQGGIEPGGASLIEEVEGAFDAWRALEAEYEALGKRLAGMGEGSPGLEQALVEHHELAEKIEDSGFHRREERIANVLEGLGFSRADYGKPAASFSAGWQMRIALAKILLESPDILLLDEPTNYLDIEARDWLESYLRSFKGGFLVVSHDRYFLDMTVSEVYELFSGRLKRYAGNYSAYEKRREAELEELLKRYREQEEEIAKLDDFIRRFRYNESKASLVQSRIKQREKIVPIEIPEGLKKLHFSFPPAPHSGRIAFRLEGVGKAYGSLEVLRGVDLLVEAGEKIALVGRNGSGKSTLMRIIAGIDSAYEGRAEPGAGIKTAYFSQDMADSLDDEASVEEEAEREAPTELIPRMRGLLGAFLFRGDDIEKKVGVLSGGERSRLALLKLLLRPANLLVFDEPTNHLDLSAKDVLLDALKRFKGTVVFVSHDRYFLEALADKVVELERDGPGPARMRVFHGGYAYYAERKAAEASGEAACEARAAQEATSEGKRGHEERKGAKAALRKLEREEAEVLEKLDAAHRAKAAAEASLADPAVYSDPAKARKASDAVEAAAREIGALEARWEAVAAELEAARGDA
jgi:ATP-binding cassette subfamily F protein 3